MHTCMMCVCTAYEVAMISRLLRIIGLFYKRALQKRPIFYKRDLYYTCMMCVCTTYEVATISRLLKNYMSLLQNIVFYDFKEPTNRSHPIMAVDVS